MDTVKKILSNKYALTALFFVVWVITLESTNVFKLYEYRSKINNYQDEIDLYQGKIEQTKKDIEDLKEPELLEKFAREEYFMKKDNEDIFIFKSRSS